MDLESRYNALVRPAICLDSLSVRATWIEGEEPVSRLGGRPNLPASAEWPSRLGKPLAFIAQLDLAALPELPELALPKSGSLFFFWDGKQEPGSGQVLFCDQSLLEIPLRDEPESAHSFGPCELTPSVEVSWPDPHSVAVDALGLSDEEVRSLWDLEDVEFVSHQIGGHARLVQGDPAFTAERATGIPATEWELLLQVGAEESSGMEWGDLGTIYYLIPREDLLTRRLDRIWLVWQFL